MSLIAMLGWGELVILAVIVGLGITCWLVFSRSSNEKNEE